MIRSKASRSACRARTVSRRPCVSRHAGASGADRAAHGAAIRRALRSARDAASQRFAESTGYSELVTPRCRAGFLFGLVLLASCGPPSTPWIAPREADGLRSSAPRAADDRRWTLTLPAHAWELRRASGT